jgi:hypothetical protein
MRFMGDENILVKNNEVYCYPFNLRSFVYKKDVIQGESVKGFYNKIKQLRYIKNNKKLNIDIQKRSRLGKIYYIEAEKKVTDIKIAEVLKDELLLKMVQNEKAEFDLAPTHTFSGINNYYFNSLLNAYYRINYRSRLKTFWDDYKNIIKDIINNNEKIFKISMPEKYQSVFCKVLYDHITEVKS